MNVRRSRRPLYALAAVVLTTSLAGAGVRQAPAAGAPVTTAAPAAPAVLPPGHTYTVTLLTGDVITVRTRASGCPVVTVQPAQPHGLLERSCGPDGHVRVIPGQVAGLIGSVLDESLFDVTTLILEGYDDARTKELPLIVRQAEQAPQRLAAPATGLRVSRSLPSVAAVAARQPKAKGAAFIRSLVADVAAGTSAKATAAAAPKTAPTRVWLDHRVRSTAQAGGGTALDPNLGQIRAPQAWAAGFTGQGVKVAVLDTGADFTHPDLQGRVADRADFTTDGGDAVDHNGHGTHVAATIAGSGAASAGRRRGVAPGAQLLVGKVLDDYGYGTDSQVIAGMEWAATRADVVNMSLGGWEPSDGTDPMSLAVDELTRTYGTLFVVAAGNDGPYEGYVSAPAAAASALTVGAVDRDDRLADFSSRGPLVNTHAAKPELVAPGVDIIAARAAGTSLGGIVDARYTSLSGTSMATPHAAGAAAILVQRHPDWQPAQLKAALVGGVDPLPATDPYEVGAGRLDVVRMLHGAVSEQAIVNLGTFTFPQSGTAQTTLSWTNTSVVLPTALRFSVTVTGRGGATAPAGAASLSTPTAIVAPGGRAATVLRLDRARLAAKPGLYTAVVTARSAAGVPVSTTPVTFFVEPRSVDLTINAIPLPDVPAGTDVYVLANVVNLDDPGLFNDHVSFMPDETPVLRVPAGRYSVMASIWEFGTASQRMALAGDPDIAVGADTAVLIDGSAARPVTASVDGVDTVPTTIGITYEQAATRGPWWSDFAFAWGEDAAKGSVFAAPVTGPGIGTFDVYASYGLIAPGDEPSPFLYDVIHPLGHSIPQDLQFRIDAAEKARLARIDQRFNLLDVPRTHVGHKRYGFSPAGGFIAETIIDDGELPGDRVDYVTPGFELVDEAFYPLGDDWFDMVTQEAQQSYAPGSRQQKVWVRQPMRTDWYDNPSTSHSGCVPYPPSRTGGSMHIELTDLTDQHQRFACFGFGDESTSSLALYRDGVLIGERHAPYGDFDVPQAAAAYRLTYDLDTSALLPVSTRVSTAWTFRSAGPTGAGTAPLALLAVDYALPLDRANHPTAGPATFTVRQAHGVTRQDVTSLQVWTSVDDGATWQAVTVSRADADSFTAQLPLPSAGQAVSLRVKADGSAGSGIDQTIIRAYRAG
ncbi:S8 family serine peptidase [Catellatospora tritici]|uniref:S8 family serine peptidase n=1 Tax=Catellatospora tritici TaxID=2851566 RepID=UPI0027E08AA6|nr:S8 family serine peptidase [Catellatospora tritici]